MTRTFDTTSNPDLHSSMRSNPFAPSEDLEQVGSLGRDLVVRLLESSGFNVEKVFFGDLGGSAGEEGPEVGLAVDFAGCEEGEESAGSGNAEGGTNGPLSNWRVDMMAWRAASSTGWRRRMSLRLTL